MTNNISISEGGISVDIILPRDEKEAVEIYLKKGIYALMGDYMAIRNDDDLLKSFTEIKDFEVSKKMKLLRDLRGISDE